ncbi:MAG: hypothetical protein V2I62_10330 [Bacteroidales bacterium]|nr:hypothetical protein [Bacteroidales bacterium]
MRDKLSPEQLAKFKRGSRLGILARQLFPGGIDLTPRSPSQYQKRVLETTEIIRQGKCDTLYEAVFQFDQLLIMLDILNRKDGEWYGYEVKSSLKISDTYLLDAAFQYYVITNSGLKLNDIFLVYVNKDYLFDEDLRLDDIFIFESVLEKVLELQDYVKEKVMEEKATLQLKSSPKIDVGMHCLNPYPCDFTGHCWKNVVDKSIIDSYKPSTNEEFYEFLDKIEQLNS